MSGNFAFLGGLTCMNNVPRQFHIANEQPLYKEKVTLNYTCIFYRHQMEAKLLLFAMMDLRQGKCHTFLEDAAWVELAKANKNSCMQTNDWSLAQTGNMHSIYMCMDLSTYVIQSERMQKLS